jgi:alanyl-tRNA synthetase
MGLERLACVLQGKKTNYEIDIFQPINQAIERELGVKVPESLRLILYAIADHVRAVVFSIADGVIPSNEGRGYVIRKLIRRAMWQAHELTANKKLEYPFLQVVGDEVVQVMHSIRNCRKLTRAFSRLFWARKKDFWKLLKRGFEFWKKRRLILKIKLCPVISYLNFTIPMVSRTS